MKPIKAPFPWFGGKSKAADVVWGALGDVPHYVEPFAGSLAVLLGRPHEANRPYYSETVNDLDGLLCNAWRTIQFAPEETARHASWPVCETDLTARHYALVKWRDEEREAWLAANPSNHDPQMAGWWLWGICSWIGSGWCAGDGPWHPDDDGRMRKWKTTRERTDGVHRKRPHLGNNGQGVNRPQLRERGVSRQLPDISNDGRGVNSHQLREQTADFRDITMPRLISWFRELSARLRHVRIINGDWRRVLTRGAAWTLPIRHGNGVAGVFLDPPYADTAKRADGLYSRDSLTVAHDCREWAIANGDDSKWRIVFAGFEGEHGDDFEQAGWRCVEWFKSGFLTGGMGNASKDGHQQDRERLWISPHCLGGDTSMTQGNLFGEAT